MFSLPPGSTGVPGTTIFAAGWNAALQAIATELNLKAYERTAAQWRTAADVFSKAESTEARNDLRLGTTSEYGDLILQRAKGSWINIGGTMRKMVTPTPLTTYGCTPGVLYYIYAYWNGSDVVPAWSTVGYTEDAATGRPEMNGDISRRLVGIAQPWENDGVVYWADKPNIRLVASRDNRAPKVLFINSSDIGILSTASKTNIELNVNFRVYFLAWKDSLVECSLSGSCLGETVGEWFQTTLAYYTTYDVEYVSVLQHQAIANGYLNLGKSFKVQSPFEGLGAFRVLGTCGAGQNLLTLPQGAVQLSASVF